MSIDHYRALAEGYLVKLYVERLVSRPRRNGQREFKQECRKNLLFFKADASRLADHSANYVLTTFLR